MANYNIGQKHYNNTAATDAFATLITEATQGYTSGEDIGVDGESEFQFNDVYIQLTNEKFEANKPYYFHAKIKRLTSDQTFYIRLKNIGSVDTTEQYIKTIQIKKAPEGANEWVDVEFIFCPYSTFDSVLFEMQRSPADLATTTGRIAVIGFEEISEINKYAPSGSEKNYVKVGIQSRPGLMMCINGEEIRLPRSGIQEIRDGILTINFFSVVSAAQETTNVLINQMNTSPIESRVFLDQPKERRVDTFTLDYIYEI